MHKLRKEYAKDKHKAYAEHGAGLGLAMGVNMLMGWAKSMGDKTRAEILH